MTMSTPMSPLARRVAEAVGMAVALRRTKRRLSQRVTAELAGLSQAALGSYEAGCRDMRVSSLIALALALDVDPADLLRAGVEAARRDLGRAA